MQMFLEKFKVIFNEVEDFTLQPEMGALRVIPTFLMETPVV